MANANSLLDDQALTWLVKLSSGRATEADEQAFFDWLHTSTAHQAAYIRAEQLWETSAILDRLPSLDRIQDVEPAPMQAPPRLAELPAPAPRSTQAPGFAKPSKLMLGNWAIAACALLAVVALGIFTGQPADRHYHLVTAVGEQQEISLEDGTRLLLNSNSQLDVAYSDKHRRARLVRGEVYFDVYPNPKRPFDVETNAGMVRVLGTHFAVREHNQDAVVTVLEGRVALGQRPLAAEAFSAQVELGHNQQLSLQQARQGSQPLTINAKAALAWRDKQLVFQNQPLAKVVEELKRYFPVTIALADAGLEQQKITAVIQIGSLDDALAALCHPLKLEPHYSADRQKVTLKPKGS